MILGRCSRWRIAQDEMLVTGLVARHMNHSHQQRYLAHLTWPDIAVLDKEEGIGYPADWGCHARHDGDKGSLDY